MATTDSSLNILLVENSDEDILLIRKAFEHTHRDPSLMVVKDGESALDYLYKRGQYVHEKLLKPDVIMLDLNLPKISGTDVLRTIKSDQNLRTIPVIILSVSNSPFDILTCYQYQANCYLVKPRNFNEFKNLIQHFDDFWRSTVRLPIDS